MSAPPLLTCPFCSLHCDDLHLDTDGGHLAGITPACALAEASFRRAWAQPSAQRGQAPFLIGEGARRLGNARRALVVVGGDADQAAVESAFRLAETISAALITVDPMDEGLALAMKSAGMLTATLGDLHKLAAQVVLLGSSPETIAPRLWHFLGEEKQSAAIHLSTDYTLETLRWQRMWARRDGGEKMPATLVDAAQKIERAPSGLVVVGRPQLEYIEPLACELLAWLAQLNLKWPWYVLYLPESANSTGVTETLLSLSGSPGSLRCEGMLTRFAPRECRLESVIQESDVILLVGAAHSLPGKSWPRDCQQRAILLSPEPPVWEPGLWIPVAQPGVDATGCMLRVDGVPVELEIVLSASFPSAAQVLAELILEAAG